VTKYATLLEHHTMSEDTKLCISSQIPVPQPTHAAMNFLLVCVFHSSLMISVNHLQHWKLTLTATHYNMNN